jgi:hypothetical protein
MRATWSLSGSPADPMNPASDRAAAGPAREAEEMYPVPRLPREDQRAAGLFEAEVQPEAEDAASFRSCQLAGPVDPRPVPAPGW